MTPRGYVEQEFFVSGRATAPAGASNDTGIPFIGVDIPSQKPPGPVEPYTTRIIGAPPADKSKFNGTLFVDWNK